MKKISLVLLAFVFTLFDLNAKEPSSSCPKIGYVNLDQILNDLPEAKKIDTELRSFETQLQNQLQKKLENLQSKMQDFQTNYEAMAEAERNQKEVEINKLQTSLQKLQQESHELLAKKQLALSTPLLQHIQKTVSKVANGQGFTHVFNKSISTTPILLHAAAEYDISNLVLKALQDEARLKEQEAQLKAQQGATEKKQAAPKQKVGGKNNK